MKTKELETIYFEFKSICHSLETLFKELTEVVIPSVNEKKYTTISWYLNADPNLITVLEKIKIENFIRNILTTHASNINMIIDSYNSQ